MKKIYNLIILLLIITLCSCKTQKVKITLNPLNGIEPETIEVSKGATIESLKSFEKDGEIFVGWYLDEEFKNRVTYPFVVEEDITFYGRWNKEIDYILDDETRTCTVRRLYYQKDKIVIPSEVSGYKVTKIGNSAFSMCKKIKEIVLPETITEIGDYAFNTCVSLTNINLPSSIEKIGENIFDGCTSLIYDNRDGLLYIDNWLVTYNNLTSNIVLEETDGIFPAVFKNNEVIKSITLTDEIKTIYDGTFEGSTLEQINIGKSLKEFSIYAFRDCIALKEVNISGDNEYYTSINGIVYNKDITELILYPSNKPVLNYTLPRTVKVIRERSCMNNQYLVNLTLSNSVEEIGEKAFVNCVKLKSITFNSNLTTINDEAFLSCNAIDNINLPSSIKKIGNNVFGYCNNIEKINIPFLSDETIDCLITYLLGNNNKSYNKIIELEIRGGNVIKKDSLESLTNLQKLTISGDIETIEEGAFTNLIHISEFNLIDGDNLKYISGILYDKEVKKLIWTFVKNNNRVINIPSTVEEIYPNAFDNLENVEEIILNEGLKKIGFHSFSNLQKLVKLVISKSVEITDQDICFNTPNVTIYVKAKEPAVNWCEGWNTYNYPVVWNAKFPKIILKDNFQHLDINESFTLTYEVEDKPDNAKIIITYSNQSIIKIEDTVITGLTDGVCEISIEIEGIPSSKVVLQLYVGEPF